MIDATQNRPLYALRHTKQSYGGRVVLDVECLDICQGEILAVVGPSGAGKSTLLRLLTFLEMPAAGEMRFQNQLVTPERPTLAQRRRATMIFQRPQLLRRSVRDNILYGLRLRGRQIKRHQSQIDRLVEQLGLTDLLDAPAHALSGGEMQRVAFARALLLKPMILMLDEPTANLDPYNIKLIESLIVKANQEDGATIVMVTHNIFQARRLADRVGLLLDGKLVETLPTEQFFNQSNRPETAAFVRGELIY